MTQWKKNQEKKKQWVGQRPPSHKAQAGQPNELKNKEKKKKGRKTSGRGKKAQALADQPRQSA